MLHVALEKCVKQIGAPLTVFTKLHHVSSSGMVKAFYLYVSVFNMACAFNRKNTVFITLLCVILAIIMTSLECKITFLGQHLAFLYSVYNILLIYNFTSRENWPLVRRTGPVQPSKIVTDLTFRNEAQWLCHLLVKQIR